MIANQLPSLDFSLGDSADMLRDSVMRFAGDEIAPQAADIDKRNAFPDDLWRKMGELGILGVTVEEQYGGFELPTVIVNVVLQMVARADAGLMTIVGLQAGVAEDIQKYASDELKKAYLPRFASGEVMGAMDLTEPQAGSDLGAIVTRATDESGRYFVDGEKIFITNGGC